MGAVVGGIGAATAEFVAALTFADDDLRRLTARIAVTLAERLDVSPSAATARELRLMLRELAEPNGPAGVDVAAMQRAWRRFDTALAQMEAASRQKGATEHHG